MPSLTKHEEDIFQKALRTGDLDPFTEYFFQLPMSGTWFTTEDRPEQYAALHGAWAKAGKPGQELQAIVDEQSAMLKVTWDPYYGSYPMFLLPHGFRVLPWIEQFVGPGISLGLAVTGAGTGKTACCAVIGLTFCALLPGFRFLNVAPTGAQSELMLGEVEKWCSNTIFRKLIRPTRGVNALWVAKGGHPTITIDVLAGHPSTFVCQTTGREGKGILGGERDWIDVDETQLLVHLETVREIITTRLRGTRSTGLPRWSKQTYITNPGHNPELIAMIDEIGDRVEKGEDDVLLLDNIDSSANIYLTKRQLDKQRSALRTSRAADRWIGGQMSAVLTDIGISEDLLELCRSDSLTEYVEEHGKHDDSVGLVQYELEWSPHKSYVVIGDTGKSSLVSLSSQNVPCIMVFEIPEDFLERPCRMAAFYWFDGTGSYKKFIKVLKHAMYRYRAQSYYDATNVQTAMEDFDDALANVPSTPIFFSGTVGPKRWAITVLTMMMSDGLLEFPHIKGLWYQARIFDPTNKRNADDIVATLLVLMLAFRVEATLLDKLVERYGWDPNEEEEREEAADSLDGTYLEEDRYTRLLG